MRTVRGLFAMLLAGLAVAASGAVAWQGTASLHIRVMLPPTPGAPPAPVARHALLISDNPASTAPRRVLTAADGTAVVPLRPGSYTVESDQPLIHEGRSVRWTVTVDVVAGRATTVDLNAANAEAEDVAGDAGAAARSADPGDIAARWQSSLVTLWLPTRRALGFVVDPRGLVATSRQAVGDAAVVEVQLSPAEKREGRVVAADAAADVAVVRIDPEVVRARPPVPLGCGAPLPALRNGVRVQAFDWFPGERTRPTDGALQRVTSRTMIADVSLDAAAVGGPAFTMEGATVGLTSTVDEKEGDPRYESRVVRADAVCDVLAAAERALASAPPPATEPLPVEPAVRIPTATLESLAKGRAGALAPPRASSAGFDVDFLTPLHVFAAPASTSFGNWHEYVQERPSVLLVRVTPKLAEPFWGTLVRGLAMSQGMLLPKIRRVKPGFLKMRALCGGREVRPIHPFRIERRVSNTDAIYEGLYAFTPEALTADCGTVALELFSEKSPETPERVTLDPGLLGQIWQDFAPYRALK